MKAKILKSEVVYQGRAFNIRQDHIQFSNGRNTNYDIVEHSGAVTLVPIDSHGNIWFVRQYRHAVGQELLELPAGTIDEGESPEDCAIREIREEIGKSAGKLQMLADFYLAPGYSSEQMFVYLASQLKNNPLDPDEDEYLETEKYPVAEVVDILSNGFFRDAKTIAALSIAIPIINKQSY